MGAYESITWRYVVCRKIQGTVVDYLMPPLSEGELMLALVGAACTRAVAVGLALALAMALWPGVSLAVAHPWAVAWFGLMGAALLAFMGLLTSIWAEKFDHNAAVTNFVVQPFRQTNLVEKGRRGRWLERKAVNASA